VRLTRRSDPSPRTNGSSSNTTHSPSIAKPPVVQPSATETFRDEPNLCEWGNRCTDPTWSDGGEGRQKGHAQAIYG